MKAEKILNTNYQTKYIQTHPVLLASCLARKQKIYVDVHAFFICHKIKFQQQY